MLLRGIKMEVSILFLWEYCAGKMGFTFKEEERFYSVSIKLQGGRTWYFCTPPLKTNGLSGKIFDTLSRVIYMLSWMKNKFAFGKHDGNERPIGIWWEISGKFHHVSCEGRLHLPLELSRHGWNFSSVEDDFFLSNQLYTIEARRRRRRQEEN